MKRDVKYVAVEKFLQLASDLGMQSEEQKGFWKIHGPKGRQVYVARTKNVGRVDISGFEVREVLPGSVNYLGGEKFGAVQEQLNMDPSRTEEAILEDFAKILAHMASLEPVVKEKKGKKAASSAEPELSEEDKKAARQRRARLLQEVAQSKGVALSKEAQELVAAELGE
jgi:hypothetical protein